MNKEIQNMAGSVRAKLNNKRKELNISFQEILRTYAMERLLYRLSKAAFADDFILKGALLFTAWRVKERRTTLDIDLLAHYNNQVSAVEKVVKEICATDVTPDGLRFDSASVVGAKIKEDTDYEGVRVKFTGFLGKSRVPMQIDFGFGDTIYPTPKTINYPVILDFPLPRLKGYAPETVVSEKFEAVVQLGALNSRMKDFYDIWLLKQQFDFQGSSLAEAIKRTFERRKTDLPQNKKLFAEEIYDENSDRQMLWKAFLTKGGIKHAPNRLAGTAKEIEGFLIEPLSALNKGIKFGKKWKASGAWM